MDEPVKTQLYLTAPPLSCLDAGTVSRVLETGQISCLLVNIADFVEENADSLEALRAAAHQVECPVVAGGDDALALDLVKRFALDGVHLEGSPKQTGWARKQIGANSIVGYSAGTSRHNAMTAAEADADYITMGPASDLEDGLLTWWAAVIETPFVLEGTGDLDALENVKGTVDFVLLDNSIWTADPVAEITKIAALLAAP